jgi:hypothetical protein
MSESCKNQKTADISDRIVHKCCHEETIVVTYPSPLLHLKLEIYPLPAIIVQRKVQGFSQIKVLSPKTK